MSHGPIARAREAFGKRDPVSNTNETGRRCARGRWPEDPDRGYCGRRGKVVKDGERVNCADCGAAKRADLAAMARDTREASRAVSAHG